LLLLGCYPVQYMRSGCAFCSATNRPMGAPPLHSGRRCPRLRETHCRWWRHSRRDRVRHQNEDHQLARHERQQRNPHGKTSAVASLFRRAVSTNRCFHRALTLPGAFPLVRARAGDRGRCVGGASQICHGTSNPHTYLSPMNCSINSMLHSEER
jgi:hypothetical protein